MIAAMLVAAGPAHAEPSAAELEKQIEAKSHELELVVEQYNKINEQLAETRAEITKLRQALPALEQRADTAHGRVADIAHTAYKTGGISGLSAILGGRPGADLLDRLGTLQKLAQVEHAEITEAQRRAAAQATATTTLQGQEEIEAGRALVLDTQRKGIETELSKLNALKIKARGSASTGGFRYTGPIPAIAGSAGVAVTFAYKAIGIPYVFAADGPEGYDCSGLTLAAWRAAGVSLPHNAAMQYSKTARINRSDLAPGDLVFYADLGHVALYAGDGKVIHAPTFGEVVKISNVDMMPPNGYGRVRS
ncbi:MAG TPA: NlpC/P60 family protein [Candidatus Limnocylindrales bacterium]|nr:NlpC/P60 family protein [Candidatus Limnocylindrales bacterium]